MSSEEVSPETWREANRRVLAKALSEFLFEGLLDAAETGGHRYRVDLVGGVSYAFAASHGAFGSWWVESDSIIRGATGLLGNGVDTPAWDAQAFFTDVADTIGTDQATLAQYMTELSATLQADAVRIEAGGRGAGACADLRQLDHSALESHMTGHNVLIANKGRLGFSAGDVHSYAPESGSRLRVLWVAVHRGLAEFRGVSSLSERAVQDHELGEETVDAFRSRLAERGLDPDAYVWLPVHPWQWEHAVRVVYAGEIAQRRLVPLGESPDEYLPQQSIRTLTNLGTRRRYDVKVPLKIVNTLIWRGIPPHCTLGAPVVTQWLAGLLGADPVLRDELRTVFLGEIASVTVRHPYLDSVPGVPYQHLETLGCIWREPVSSRADPDERIRTLSSLLHVDESGTAFVAELVRTSRLPAQEWVERLLEVLFEPVLHVLYTYGITFNPHGQNTLVGFGPDEAPRRLFLKDFVDDVSVSHEPDPQRGPEPDGHDHVLPRKPPTVIRQHVVDQLLVGHCRYLAPLLSAQLGIPEDGFWGMVRDRVLAYQKRYPEKAERFAAYDLLAPEFPRYAFNRDRLVVTRYTDSALRHALAPNGAVPNPLAR